ncbi:Short-chain dehydrogenase/reductase family protein [Mycena sanguinolenta]|uniref:Short-chain dehydrogenase/reductase family protein n=1 Tax=Mycena sanguinolenta TaxID=230812 RepID=A0A8H7DFC0_9AGAR|nr:Short-chain dehydrogenase/reductase family protein [Mycena sanguinolenta]
MDAPLHPPLRIDAISSTSLSSKSAQKRLESLLVDFQGRTTAAQGGGGRSAVTVQVQKLRDALKEERDVIKAVSSKSI